jgi:predicted nucleic acid-binding protein
MPMSYLDSSILVSWMLQDKHYSKTRVVKDKIESGTIKGIVSTLVVLETIGVLRKRITEDFGFVGDSRSANLAALEAEIDDATRRLMVGISALASQGKLIWDDPPLPVDQVLKRTLSILQPYKGEIWTAYNCGACKSRLATPEYFYRGIGHYDVQHGIIAKEESADDLLTVDQFYDDFNGVAYFSPMKFVVL